MAYFNLCRLNLKKSQTSASTHVAWQQRDYTQFSAEELFKQLEEFNLFLDQKSFLSLAEPFESPEALLQALFPVSKEIEIIGPPYVRIFALWKLLAKHKRSLSILGYDLDRIIEKYDTKQDFSTEHLQNLLWECLRVLENSAHTPEENKAAFQQFSEYLAHNLEWFLYDYAKSLLAEGNNLQASEIIDDFFPYIHNESLFHFLQISQLFDISPSTMIRKVRSLIEEDNQSTDLLLEIARFAKTQKQKQLFLEIIPHLKNSLSTEKDFLETLSLSCDLMKNIGDITLYERLHTLISERNRSQHSPILDKTDQAVEKYFSLMQNPNGVES